MHAGKGKDALGKVLSELVTCAVSHFATEERLMGPHHYENAAAHKAEHAKLVKDVSDLKTKCELGNAMLSIEITNFVCDWFSRRITKTDKKLGQALSAAGVK
jgi:hemerythrin